MNFEKGKVSVLIGTYNRCDLLQRCLDSVFNQSHKNIEVIVVNDKSADNTIEVLEKYKKMYTTKFKYINNKINKGIAYNSNLAFSLSTGEYLALIGDDDEWIDTDKIIKQIDVFETNKNVGIVGTYWQDITNGKVIKTHKPFINADPVSQILKRNGVYCGSSVLISRKAWLDVNGFDENMRRGTDSELFRSIILKGYKTTLLQEYTTNVFIDNHPRMTPANSLSSIRKSIATNLYLIKKYIFVYIKHPLAFSTRLASTAKLYLRYLIQLYLK